jgi:hypothetical protein
MIYGLFSQKNTPSNPSPLPASTTLKNPHALLVVEEPKESNFL